MAADENHRRSKLTAILVVVLICFSLILFTVIYNIYTPSYNRKSGVFSNYAVIHGACKAARNHSACEASLKSEWRAGTGVPATALQAINATLQVSTRHLHGAISRVEKILAASAGGVNHSDVARLCLEVLRYSDRRAAMAAEALARGAGGVKDARAWMSASLAYHYGCMSGLRNVNDTLHVAEAASFFNTTLIGSTADVLAMMASYDYFGEETGKWGPPKTERDGFWPSSAGPSEKVGGGVPSGMAVNVTVCGGCGCDYKTVQEAVGAAPDNSSGRFVIRIKTGVYNETVRVGFEKKNVVFLGDGMGKTVITGAMNVGMPRVSTYNSATVGVMGDGFMASNLTIENTAGVDAHQAVAFRSDSDLSILENCEFIGNQDTLYAHSLRQYYKSCRIQGNIDFIFGQSAAVFQDCLILIAPHQNEPEKGGDYNPVAAHGRIDPAQSTGFVFQDCVINGTDEYMAMYAVNPDVHKSYLGRPWKEYSRTVFLGCTLETLLSVDGWLPWGGDFALKTLYYGEFENKGPGADTSKRVNWSSVVPAEHVDLYSVRNFIQGDQWIPKTQSL
ncbi:pectinesterase [Salvia divinorum]|uniref:Pectinesterase n=1 Tax=Salvia divinorum TaxID=28513 RepID=A0ABD1HA10_SALDI